MIPKNNESEKKSKLIKMNNENQTPNDSQKENRAPIIIPLRNQYISEHFEDILRIYEIEKDSKEILEYSFNNMNFKNKLKLIAMILKEKFDFNDLDQFATDREILNKENLLKLIFDYIATDLELSDEEMTAFE